MTAQTDIGATEDKINTSALDDLEFLSYLDGQVPNEIDEEEIELLEGIEALLELEKMNPAAYYWNYQATPGQRHFHEDKHQNRLMRCGSKVGKTSALSVEAWLFLTGTHPHNKHWDVPAPCKILYTVADFDKNYADDVCASLKEYEPEGVLAPGCTYDAAKGYMYGGKRQLVLKNGSRIMFRSSWQDQMAVQGVAAHVVIVNEPPKEKMWAGIMRAAANFHAPVLVGFTVTGESLSWLQYIVEVDPVSSKLWGQTVIEVCPENIPWRPAEDVLEQIANVPKSDRDCMVYGAWEGTNEDRSYDGFTAESITTQLPAGEDVDLWLGIDHGEKPGHEAAVFVATWKAKYTGKLHGLIVDEYVSGGHTTPAIDCTKIHEMVQKWGFSLYQIKGAVGDVNSAGKSAAGTSVNEMMEMAFAELTDSYVPPFSIRKASKGPGSVLGNQKVINAALVSGRLKVLKHCVETIKCFRQWRGGKSGKDGKYTHLLDAIRYILSDKLDPTKNKAPVILKVGQ